MEKTTGATAAEMAAGLMTVAEAARALGVSPQRVVQLIRAGRLDAVQKAKEYLISAASVAARARG